MAAVVSAEDSAEKLKYDVRKQVQEALDISEALKSLQRSLTSEISRRQRAEDEKVVVAQKLAVLKERAKQLGDLIRREKETRRTIPDYTTDSDEEEEEEDNLNEAEDDDDDLGSLMSMIDSNSGSSTGNPSGGAAAGAGAAGALHQGGAAGVRGDRLGHNAATSATSGASPAASSAAGAGGVGRGSAALPAGGRPSAIAAANRRGFASAPSARGARPSGAGNRSAQTFQRAQPRMEMPDLEMQLILAEIQGATPTEIQERVLHALPFVATSRAAVSPAAVTIRGAMALPVFPQFKPESETQKQLRADELRFEKQFKIHMTLLRDWLKREHARIEAQGGQSAWGSGQATVFSLLALQASEEKQHTLMQAIVEKYVVPMLATQSPYLSVIFSNYVSILALHGRLTSFLREEGKNAGDLHELDSLLRDVTTAYSQYAMERCESRQVIRANPSLLPANGTVSDLNAALDQPIEYFSQYPRLLQALMNTIAVSSAAYCAFAFMLADIYRILRQINVKPAQPRGTHEELCDNSRIQTIDVQLLFDWHDLPNTPNDLAAPDRTLIKTAVFRKTHTPKNQRDQPREIVYHAFLFNDVLMIGRPSPTIDKLWFKAIFPLDKLIIWDVPDRHVSANKNVFELVHIKKKSAKTVISASSAEEKQRWVSLINNQIVKMQYSFASLDKVLK